MEDEKVKKEENNKVKKEDNKMEDENVKNILEYHAGIINQHAQHIDALKLNTKIELEELKQKQSTIFFPQIEYEESRKIGEEIVQSIRINVLSDSLDKNLEVFEILFDKMDNNIKTKIKKKGEKNPITG